VTSAKCHEPMFLGKLLSMYLFMVVIIYFFLFLLGSSFIGKVFILGTRLIFRF